MDSGRWTALIVACLPLALACCLAAGLGAAFGQAPQEQATTTVLKTLAPPAGGYYPIMTPPTLTPLPLQAPIVISFGRGGLVDEHRETFAGYQRHKVKVEIRGPCYSACTLVLAFVAPENLCIAERGFMAFHAIRSSAHGEIMPGATAKWMYWEQPMPIRRWIDRNGGWEKLPLHGYWTMYDHELWAMGYPRCKP